jgi:Ca-activated chloride channel family protein
MGTQEQVVGGMFVRGSEARVPLCGVGIRVVGSGAAARVTVRQRYVNAETVPVEAVYSFPLEEGSAVCALCIETGGRTLAGRIEEREKAFEQYDEALAAGHGAVLADQDRPNIFTVSVGNLLPGQEATVCLEYVTELAQHGRDVRLMLPTTIAPRYVPPPLLVTIDPAELERINPPTVLGPVPYGLSLTVEYTAPQGVASVACPSHPAQVAVEGNRARVELMGANVQLDRDFVLDIALTRPFEPCAVVAPDGAGAHALMINLYPDLGQYARQAAEYVFVVDRSGSMAGESIEQALNALRLALRSLEEGDAFNIVGFGSRFQLMFPQSRPYTQAALEEATRQLESWDADLGGTELLAPLQAVLAVSSAALPRRVMLLTDGQVANEAACIALAAKHAAAVRMFTFGIGYGASEQLVKGLARASGGKAEFIHPNERIEPVVMRQFARAAAPSLNNVRLDWGGLRPELVTPRALPSLFAGDRLTVYARVPGGAERGAVEVAVLAEGSRGRLRFPVRVDVGSTSFEHCSAEAEPTSVCPNEFEPTGVPALMARAAIRELEEGRGIEAPRFGSQQRTRKAQGVDAQVLELALRYQLLSSQTSFVAIEERVEGVQTERAQLRRVPVALTHGWGGVERALQCTTRVSMACASRALMDLDIPAFQHRAGGPATDIASAAVCFDLVDAFDPGLDAARSVEGLSRSMNVSSSRGRKPATPVDGFMRLTLSQRADGSFRFDEATLREFGLEAAALARAAEQLGGGEAAEAVVHTAVALVLLERRFAGREDEWRMLADKARRWLDRQAVALPQGENSWTGWAAMPPRRFAPRW